MSWNRQVRAVNSKVLLAEITKTIEELLDTVDLLWHSDTHRETFVAMVQEYLGEFAEDTGKIDQHKVICDFRNNRLADIEKGLFYLTIEYRQLHCLNTTQVLYTIRLAPEAIVS